MTLKFTPEQIAGLTPDSLLAELREMVPGQTSLAPPAARAIADAPQVPTLPPLMPASTSPGGSHAYRVVEALLRVSEAVYGGAVLKHDALARTWDIRTSADTGVRILRESTATVITPYSRVRGRWRPMRSQRYPPLSLPELGRLFFWRTPDA